VNAAQKMVRWIDRQGGMLVAPRRTIAALGPDEGRRDGTWALFAWLLGVQVMQVFQIAARIGALRNFDAVLGGAADLAFSLLPPFIATFAVELVLGGGRSHRAGVCLAPMIATGTSLHLAALAGVLPAMPGWVLPVLAGAAAVGVAAWARAAVTPVPQEAK
jgi:hypothetical protein